MKEVYIVSAVRTPIGSFGGVLSSQTATQLGAVAIRGAIEKAGISPSMVQDVYMGNVLSANLGQAPVTQASIYAGLPNTIPGTTINKVCASGMKAIMIAAQSIALGDNEIVVAGGMESMSNVPYYLDKARRGYSLGHGQVTDGLMKDGLWDVYNNFHMGSAAELCAKECGITREEQDAFAIQSYKRAADAWQRGAFKEEIVPVSIPQKGKADLLVYEDEEYTKVNFEKIPGLKPVFEKEGTVTAANASTLNDGASALVLMSGARMNALNLKPLAQILGFADAQKAPEHYTTAPAKALPLAITKAGVALADIEYFEINEAFAVVGIANNKALKIDPEKVNVNGGAVALGHPLGSSGSRIVVSLVHILQQKNATLGAAAICNGGGGASAIVIKRIE